MTLHLLPIKAQEIPNPGCRAVLQGSMDLLVCRSGNEVYAVQNLCPHAGSKLAGGKVRGHFIFCPEHGARFDLRTGASASPLTNKPLQTFHLHGDADMLRIELP